MAGKKVAIDIGAEISLVGQNSWTIAWNWNQFHYYPVKNQKRKSSHGPALGSCLEEEERREKITESNALENTWNSESCKVKTGDESEKNSKGKENKGSLHDFKI